MVVNVANIQWTHNADYCVHDFGNTQRWKQCLLKINLEDIMPELTRYTLWLRPRKAYTFVANTWLKEFDVSTYMFLYKQGIFSRKIFFNSRGKSLLKLWVTTLLSD